VVKNVKENDTLGYLFALDAVNITAISSTAATSFSAES